jgi:hypothetical protein
MHKNKKLPGPAKYKIESFCGEVDARMNREETIKQTKHYISAGPRSKLVSKKAQQLPDPQKYQHLPKYEKIHKNYIFDKAKRAVMYDNTIGNQGPGRYFQDNDDAPKK